MSPKLSCLDCGIPTQRSRCDACFAIREASKPKRERPTSSLRGYDAQWQRIRIQILRRDGWICCRCNKKLSGADATVDHITPLSRGGVRLDESNLISMCRSCNSSKKDN